jgi:hypothetical protein
MVGIRAICIVQCMQRTFKIQFVGCNDKCELSFDQSQFVTHFCIAVTDFWISCTDTVVADFLHCCLGNIF